MSVTARLLSAAVRARALLAAEWGHLVRVNASDRPLEMPLAAAVASGLPVLIGAAYGQLAYGLAASLGGMVFLYLPAARLSQRMAWLMACAFGLIACYALGILSQIHEPLTVPVLTLIAIVVTIVCRFYAVPPPGSLFFVLAAAIGGYSGSSGLQQVLQVGLVAMGSVLAVGVAFLYSLHVPASAAAPAAAAAPRDFDFVVRDSVVIGVFVGLSLAIAQLLQLSRPYWVPVSCLAVIQALSLRALWVRQFHRIAGTALGLLLFWWLSTLTLGDWSLAWVMIGLIVIIETLVVRHYGLAVVFITPLTILLAEGGHLAQHSPQALMQARLIDTVIGCLVGLAGGFCLHNARIREALGRALRRVLPSPGNG